MLFRRRNSMAKKNSIDKKNSADDKLIRYTLRIDPVVYKKVQVIAAREGRSANKTIERYLKKCVLDYEEENGKIKISND